MSSRRAFKTVLLAALTVIGCNGSAPSLQGSSTPETARETPPPVETTQVDGWWERGDSAGPFSAELFRGDVVSVDRELSHGEYGSTRDHFEFAAGRLIHYSQESELRLMDADDPSRLVPVSLRLDFGDSGNLSKGEKTIDGVTSEIESADIERVRVQVEPLVEQVRLFERMQELGGEPVQYLCPEGQTVAVTFAGDSAVLDLGPTSGRYILTRQPAASGAKYGDDLFVFWTKGDEALVDRFGEPWLRGCSVED